MEGEGEGVLSYPQKGPVLLLGKVRPGNPLHSLIRNSLVPISISVCLRSGSSSRPMATRTERFSNFVSVNYQSCQ